MTTRELAQCALIGLLAMVTVERRSVGLWEVFPPLIRTSPPRRPWTREMNAAYIESEDARTEAGWFSALGWRAEARSIRRAIRLLDGAPR